MKTELRDDVWKSILPYINILLYFFFMLIVCLRAGPLHFSPLSHKASQDPGRAIIMPSRLFLF